MNVQISKRDYVFSIIAGLLTGVCLIPIFLRNGYHNNLVFAALPFAMAVIWVFGMLAGKALSQLWGVIYQLAKFAEVGFLNTAIDFGLLNLISLMTGVTAGVGAGNINIPGKVLSACNSYIWNKLWVFEKIDDKGFFVDVPKFAIVTIVSTVLNSIILVLFTSYIHPLLGLAPSMWLNIGKVVATAGTFLINFLGYKFIVFVKGK